MSNKLFLGVCQATDGDPVLTQEVIDKACEPCKRKRCGGCKLKRFNDRLNSTYQMNIDIKNNNNGGKR
jgi:hypothetical protein